MILDLARLKLQAGKSEEFHFLQPAQQDFLADIGGQFLEPLDVQVVLENTGALMSGRGRVKTLLVLSCGRCLESFQYPVNAEMDLVLAESLEGQELDPDDVLWVQGDQADILPRVEEIIFSQIPLNPLCSPTCQGLCPVCGANKNLADCSCQTEDIDPRWEQLKKLSFD